MIRVVKIVVVKLYNKNGRNRSKHKRVYRSSSLLKMLKHPHDILYVEFLNASLHSLFSMSQKILIV
jgi:hypothetical protein